ncbi:MAG TPA: hypothetical protein VMU11_04020 [Verrucomicrobiae bacterium]|nr:hypothetical protein [Verrucomicrobiae bacterium]
MNTTLDPVIVLPKEAVDYTFCKPRVPLEVELILNLVQCFVPTDQPSNDLPYQVRFRRTGEPVVPYRDWPIPLAGRLSVERIKGLKGGLKLRRSPSTCKLVLKTGSFRVGIQQAMLGWIAPGFSVRVCYTLGTVDPEKNAVWRVEALFGGHVLNQWDAKNDLKQDLFEVVRP